MTYKLNFGHHQLAVSLNRKLGRPKRTAGEQFRYFVTQLIKFSTDKRRSGHPVSRALRFAFESKKSRLFFGTNLIIIVILAGSLAGRASAFSDNPQLEIITLKPDKVEMTTESSTQLPVDSFNISQGYKLSHHALDLKMPVGSPVHPIMAGTIEQTISSQSAYGKHVIINHGDDFKSLYAHLSKIEVQVGQVVDKNTVLGTVGSTGHSTGPHLHLEVSEGNQPLNPLSIIE